MVGYGYFLELPNYIFLKIDHGVNQLERNPLRNDDSHVKVMGMLVVLLRGVHCRFWSRLGCLRCHSGIA